MEIQFEAIVSAAPHCCVSLMDAYLSEFTPQRADTVHIHLSGLLLRTHSHTPSVKLLICVTLIFNHLQRLKEHQCSSSAFHEARVISPLSVQGQAARVWASGEFPSLTCSRSTHASLSDSLSLSESRAVRIMSVIISNLCHSCDGIIPHQGATFKSISHHFHWLYPD